MATNFRGEKYDATLNTAEIARRVRADIKEALKAGRLPAGLKVSVQSRCFAGGSSIDITVKEYPGFVLNPASFFAAMLSIFETRARVLHRLELRRTCAALSRILTAYHRDNSDTARDYFDVNFYASVNVECDARAERVALASSPFVDELRAAKVAGKELTPLLDTYDKSGAVGSEPVAFDL